jgi:hypothetical protein
MALPTANIKDGNTRSVGVKPFQWAWCSGAKVVASLPGMFTIIIKQIVIPLKTSSAVKRCTSVVRKFWSFVAITRSWFFLKASKIEDYWIAGAWIAANFLMLAAIPNAKCYVYQYNCRSTK